MPENEELCDTGKTQIFVEIEALKGRNQGITITFQRISGRHLKFYLSSLFLPPQLTGDGSPRILATVMCN